MYLEIRDDFKDYGINLLTSSIITFSTVRKNCNDFYCIDIELEKNIKKTFLFEKEESANLLYENLKNLYYDLASKNNSSNSLFNNPYYRDVFICGNTLPDTFILKGD